MSWANVGGANEVSKNADALVTNPMVAGVLALNVIPPSLKTGMLCIRGEATVPASQAPGEICDIELSIVSADGTVKPSNVFPLYVPLVNGGTIAPFSFSAVIREGGCTAVITVANGGVGNVSFAYDVVKFA